MKIASFLSNGALLFLIPISLSSHTPPINDLEKFTPNLPKETPVLTLLKSDCKWKKMSRIMEKDSWIVERIPVHQHSANWIDAIAIHITNVNGVNIRTISIERVAETIKKDLEDQHSGLPITWEQNRISDSELMYESYIPSGAPGIASMHEIVRVFLTNDGIHRIGIRHRYERMSNQERIQWTAILQNKVSIKSLRDAHAMKSALSIW